MRMRTLGRTGVVVSEFGLGTWAMGGGIYGAVDDAESIRTIHRAEELGVTFIDTAPMYGMSETQDGRAERVVGEALKGRRDRWVISTKYGRHLRPGERGVEIHEDYSAAQCVRSVEASLKRLQTDYIDVYFVHTPTPDPELFRPEESFGAMVRLKEEGKIRAVGFSFHETTASWLPAIEPYLRDGTCEVVQTKLSLLVFDALDLLFPIVEQSGTGVVAREAMAMGFLTDSFTADGPFDPQDYKSRLPRAHLERMLAKADQFRFLIEREPTLASLPEAALNWVVSHPQVSTVIPGPKSVAELEQCLRAAHAARFSEETLAETRAIQRAWAS